MKDAREVANETGAVVAEEEPSPEATSTPTAPAAEDSQRALPELPSPSAPPSRFTPRGYRWAQLLARTFELDVLACGRCGGRLRLLATIADPLVIRKILAHLGLPTTCPEPLPARPPTAGLFAYDAA